MTPPRKLHIKSYGCQMNVYDAQRMADMLAPEGYVETASAEDADLVILNTCHIREKARGESLFRTWQAARRQEPGGAGGADDRRRRRLRRAGRGRGDHPTRARVDLVVGPQSYHHLPQLLALPRKGRPAARSTPNFAIDDKFGFLPAAVAARHSVPRYPGRLRDGAGRLRQVLHLLRRALYARRRALASGGKIVAEVERLADYGVREITLIGPERQRLSWRRPGWAALAARQAADRLARIPGSPGCATRPAIRATWTTTSSMHTVIRRADAFVHLPVQSGSDRILAAMNRQHTRR